VPYTSNFQTHYVALKDEKFATILALLYACLELSHGVGVERKISILNVSESFLFPVTRVLKGLWKDTYPASRRTDVTS
jgi:hypothetical protein